MAAPSSSSAAGKRGDSSAPSAAEKQFAKNAASLIRTYGSGMDSEELKIPNMGDKAGVQAFVSAIADPADVASLNQTIKQNKLKQGRSKKDKVSSILFAKTGSAI